MRELLGTGALFSDMHLLFGEAARNWKWLMFEDYPGFLFAILPPGAFVGLGLLIALKNIIDARLEERRKQQTPKTLTGSKRVRVTG
jgi:electron transport complex protein RnfE